MPPQNTGKTNVIGFGATRLYDEVLTVSGTGPSPNEYAAVNRYIPSAMTPTWAELDAGIQLDRSHGRQQTRVDGVVMRADVSWHVQCEARHEQHNGHDGK